MPRTAFSPPPRGAATNASPGFHGVDQLSLFDPGGIELEDISLVEFVREWGRAIARTALDHAAARRRQPAE